MSPKDKGNGPGPLLAEEPGGHNVYYQDRWLYPRGDALEGTLKKIRAFTAQKNTVYILPSPLLFYGVRELEEKLPSSSRLCLVELDPLLENLGRPFRKEIKEFPEEVFPLITSWQSFLDWAKSLDFSGIRRAELFPVSGGYGLYAKEYRLLAEELNNQIQRYWKNRATLVQMGRLWIKNLFDNLTLLPGSRPLSSLKTDLPIFLAGAGESLEGVLEELTELRSQVFLLAVDTALPVLLDQNCPPDAVVALESQHINIMDFLSLEGRKIPLICDLSVSPSLLHRYPGPISFFATRFAEIALFDELEKAGINLPNFAPMGSVGLSALQIALALSHRAVFFAGLDFSFSPGKTHARSSPAAQRLLAKTSRLRGLNDFSHGFPPPLRRVLGKTGRPLLSTPAMLDYASLMSQFKTLEGLFDMGAAGLPLGFPQETRLKTALEGRESLSWPQRRDNVKARGLGWITEDLGPPADITVKNYIAGELKSQEDLITRGYQWLRGGRSEKDSQSLLAAIRKKDYLYMFFPDGLSGENAALSESFVKRLLTHCAYLAARLRKTG